MLFYMVTGQSPPKNTIKFIDVDEELFVRIGNNEMNAFEELYNRTERAVYSYVLSILRHPEDTQDIVQETYLKIRAAAHLYKPMGKPMAWIFTIARNLSMNLLNQKSRKQATHIDDLEDNIDLSYINDETDKLVLEAAMQILTEDERQILLLHAVSGMKHREIAENLNSPISTILSRYNRSLKKLRAYLSEQGATA